MTVNLSIKNVPDPLVEKLRARASSHHRSLQGELMVILEEALKQRRLSLQEVHQMVVESGLHTPADSVDIIRADRDAR